VDGLHEALSQRSKGAKEQRAVELVLGFRAWVLLANEIFPRPTVAATGLLVGDAARSVCAPLNQCVGSMMRPAKTMPPLRLSMTKKRKG